MKPFVLNCIRWLPMCSKLNGIGEAAFQSHQSFAKTAPVCPNGPGPEEVDCDKQSPK